ncbi:MAG: hypothetical protein ACPG7F_19810 [Aggregatilineales bacterium]
MDFGNNRNTLILAFILMMLGAVALMESSALVVMILLGLLFLVRQFDNNQLLTESRYDTGADYSRDYNYDYDYGDDDYEDDEWEEALNQNRQAQSEPVYRHALESVQRAGLNPDEVQVLPVDIGVMTFQGQSEPTVYRTWSLPDDVDYVQPFVQLRLPSRAQGRVRFEILDSTGNSIFVHDDVYNLERGRNFVSPAARLPVHDERNMQGKWQMRVIADGVLLAEHRFEFAEAQNAAIQRHIGEDGEINTELRAVMAESRLPKMSLDDLLSYQDEEDAGQQSASK